MKIICIVLFIFLLPTPGTSQFVPQQHRFFENGQPTRTGPDAAMFPDSPTRMKLDLSGQWRFTMDNNTWNSVSVPCAYDFKGKVTFMRSFDVKPEMLDKYTFSLVVYGMNYQSEISINENFIGRHMGGYTSFILPIPQNTLQVGTENAIKVFIDNELTPKTTLPLRQPIGGWRTYGGIFRDIYILATPKLGIESVDATYEITKDGKNVRAAVQVQIADRAATIQTQSGEFLGLQVEAYDKLSGELAGKSGITPFTPIANKSIDSKTDVVLSAPKLWSTETPDLYVFKCQLVFSANKQISVLDEMSFDVGIRELQWREGRLFVNGVLTPLKGVLWLEDHATYGSALTYEVLEKDIAMIKSIGANCIRFPYPPHPYMLNLCDRYGILVLEEIPLVDIPSEILAKDYFQDLAATYIREMISRDKLHTSILAWGIGNGFETLPQGSCDYVNDMRNIAKSADARLVYFASDVTVKNPCYEYADLIAINHPGGEPKRFRELLKEWKSAFPEKPIIVAQYGQEVEPGNHNGYSDPLSMESQARTIMQTFESIKDAKIAGGIVCAYDDWRTDRPALTTHSKDPYLKAVGLVGLDREKRTAFDVTRALFNGEKIQALPVGNYSSNAPMIYVISGIVALISFFFFYNGNRRFRDSVNRSLFRTYNFFADVRDQRVLLNVHSFFLAIIVSITWATLLSSFFSHYRENVFLDNMMSQFLSDWMKEWLIRLVWNPVEFIGIMSAVIFGTLLLLSIFIKIISLTVRTRVYFYHAFSITMWSMLPYVILIPVAMIFYRLSMDTDFYLMPVVILILVISLWVFLRLLKGISIIYDVFPMKVYALGILLIVIASAVVYSYLDYTRSTSVYLKHIVQEMKKSA